MFGFVPLECGVAPCVVKKGAWLTRGVVVEDYCDCVRVDVDTVVVVVWRPPLVMVVVKVAG